MPRVMPDPIPLRGGMLTEGELAACLRVLCALRTTICATTVLTWAPEDTRAYVILARAGYTESLARWPEKLTEPFRWDRIRISPAGAEYLRQIEAL